MDNGGEINIYSKLLSLYVYVNCDIGLILMKEYLKFVYLFITQKNWNIY